MGCWLIKLRCLLSGELPEALSLYNCTMKKAIIHLGLWTILGYLFFVSLSLVLPWQVALSRTITGLLLIALMFYVAGELLTTQFLIRRRNLVLFSIFIVLAILVIAGLRSRFLAEFPGTANNFWQDTLRNRAGSGFSRNSIILNRISSGRSPIIVGVLLNMVVATIAVLLSLYEHKAAKELESREKLQRSQEAQILYLKSQVNPHFLFNTLNNLYGLTYAKSDLAPQMVLGLSDTMRYLIYETEQKLVPISKELDFVRNYLGLEKMRISVPENIRVSMQVSNESAFIPPLLLLPFVENCFKHGSIGKDEDGWLEMDIWDEGERFCFVCKNSVLADGNTSRKPGIGLGNVKKRLELIYGEQFELQTLRLADEFLVSLNFPVFERKDQL